MLHSSVRLRKVHELREALNEHAQLMLRHREPPAAWPPAALERAHALRERARHLADEIGLPPAASMGEISRALHTLQPSLAAERG
jgi:hypothetical protein